VQITILRHGRPEFDWRRNVKGYEFRCLEKAYDSAGIIGHGFLNHHVAKELLVNNWMGPSNPGRKYWEFGTYEYERT
jgi:hypothetical protein